MLSATSSREDGLGRRTDTPSSSSHSGLLQDFKPAETIIELLAFLLWDEYRAMTLSGHPSPRTEQHTAWAAAAAATSPGKRSNNASRQAGMGSGHRTPDSNWSISRGFTRSQRTDRSGRLLQSSAPTEGRGILMAPVLSGKALAQDEPHPGTMWSQEVGV